MFHKRDEEAERQRQAKERAAQSLDDRLYTAKKVTAAGTYSLQHERRTGRMVQFNTRIRPKVRHIVEALIRRDKVPSLVVFFELMLEAYQAKYGALREGDIPPDEEIIDMFLNERDNRDAK
jgi:hypothetical protein